MENTFLNKIIDLSPSLTLHTLDCDLICQNGDCTEQVTVKLSNGRPKFRVKNQSLNAHRRVIKNQDLDSVFYDSLEKNGWCTETGFCERCFNARSKQEAEQEAEERKHTKLWK